MQYDTFDIFQKLTRERGRGGMKKKEANKKQIHQRHESYTKQKEHVKERGREGKWEREREGARNMAK